MFQYCVSIALPAVVSRVDISATDGTSLQSENTV